MPISSLIVRTEKDATERVAEELKSIKEASVSKVHENNIIVITDTDKQADDKDLWKRIEKIPGVVQCDLIYHNFEDDVTYGNK